MNISSPEGIAQTENVVHSLPVSVAISDHVLVSVMYYCEVNLTFLCSVIECHRFSGLC